MDRSDRESVAASLSTSMPATCTTPLGPDQLATALARWLTGREVEEISPSRVPTWLRADTRVDTGHETATVPRFARWLIYAPGVAREHSSRLAALRDGVEQASYPDVIRSILRRGGGIAVAGRRPGRIASAMIGWTMLRAGLDPTILLRGDVPQLGGPSRSGLGHHAVVDVSGNLGLALDNPPGPSVAVLLDPDDPDDAEPLARAVESVGPSGYVLTGPCLTPSALRGDGRIASVSLERGSTWWGADLREDRGRYRFRAFHRGRFAAEIRLQVPGRASVLGALAAVATCDRAEVPIGQIKQALEDFTGVSGGFESRGSYRGVTLVADDATEPRDVAEALALARAVHGRRRTWAVLAASGPPRPPMADALAWADRVVVVGEASDAASWAGMLEAAGIAARPSADLGAALDDLDRHLEPGDVLLTLGSGDVGTIADAFLRRISRDRPGR